MKRFVITLLILLTARLAYAGTILFDGFEYANHDGETPVGWVCDDNSWLCGYLDKDHNRTPHDGNWYVYTNANDSWMFMENMMSTQLRYRYYFWAISDGEYDVEFWAGSGPSHSEMTTLLLTKTVNASEYQQFMEYIDTVAVNYQYFGIHAIAHEGAYHLTIDDVQVDMVDKYEITVTPPSYSTTLTPGEQTGFSFIFNNLGYEPANVIITPSSDYFTDINLSIDGTVVTTFHAEPNESLEIRGVATMLPSIEIGTTCWIDILFDLDCSCASTMFTLWAIAEEESVEECGYTAMSIYPNPSTGDVTIEGDGIVTITNILGQEVLSKEIMGKETLTLGYGIYFIRLNNRLTKKLIVK